MTFSINEVPFASPIVFNEEGAGQGHGIGNNNMINNGFQNGGGGGGNAGNTGQGTGTGFVSQGNGAAQMDVDDTSVGNAVLVNGEALGWDGMDHTEGLGNLKEGAYATNNGLIPGVADVHGLGEEVEMGTAGQLHCTQGTI